MLDGTEVEIEWFFFFLEFLREHAIKINNYRKKKKDKITEEINKIAFRKNLVSEKEEIKCINIIKRYKKW